MDNGYFNDLLVGLYFAENGESSQINLHDEAYVREYEKSLLKNYSESFESSSCLFFINYVSLQNYSKIVFKKITKVDYYDNLLTIYFDTYYMKYTTQFESNGEDLAKCVYNMQHYDSSKSDITKFNKKVLDSGCPYKEVQYDYSTGFIFTFKTKLYLPDIQVSLTKKEGGSGFLITNNFNLKK